LLLISLMWLEDVIASSCLVNLEPENGIHCGSSNTPPASHG